MVLAMEWFWHLVSARLKESRFPSCPCWCLRCRGLLVTTTRKEKFQWSPYGLHGHCIGGENPDTELGRPLLTHHHWDDKGTFCYCKVRLQVQSALVVHWHHRSGGTHCHLGGREVLASYLALSDITLWGVGHPVTVWWDWKSMLILSLLVVLGVEQQFFLCHLAGEWLLTKGFLLC